MVGTRDVEQRIWLAPKAKPVTMPRAVAERRIERLFLGAAHAPARATLNS